MNVNGILYFAATTADNGQELWKSDGTDAGTALVKDIYQGTINATLSNLVNLNGSLLFVASEPVYGAEIYKTDGTAANTLVIKDINDFGTRFFCLGPC